MKRLPNLDACKRVAYLDACKPKQKIYVPMEIGEDLPPERDIEITGRAISGLENQIWFPEHTFVQCPIGLHTFCAKCRLPTTYPSGTISWGDDRELQAQVFGSKDVDRALTKHVIGKPSQCMLAVIKHSAEGRSMFQWDVSKDEQDKMQTDVPVYSEVSPEMASEMLVQGTTFLPKEGENTVHVLADTARPHEKAPFQLAEHLGELLQVCPHDATSIPTL